LWKFKTPGKKMRGGGDSLEPEVQLLGRGDSEKTGNVGPKGLKSKRKAAGCTDTREKKESSRNLMTGEKSGRRRGKKSTRS